MRKFLLLAILALPLFTAGCGMITVNGTGVTSLFASTGASITLKNDSDYVISVVVNNQQVGWEENVNGKKRMCIGVAPGARIPIDVSNWWNSYDRTIVVTVDGWVGQQFKESIGSASYPITAGAQPN